LIRLLASILAVPLAEYVFLRLWIRELLHLRVGWGSLLIDYDLFLSVPLAVAAFSWILSQDRSFKLHFSRSRLVLHLVSLAAFVVLNFALSQETLSLVDSRGIWWVLCGISFASGCFIWIAPKTLLTHPNRIPMAVALAMALVVVVAKHFESAFTRHLDEATFAQACWFSENFFGLHVDCSYDSFAQLSVLRGPMYAVRLGAGCRGYDGTLLFIGFTYIYFSLRSDRLANTWAWYGLFFTGSVLTLILNAFRISALEYLGEWATRFFGYPFAKQWVGELFHAHIGLLFSFGFFLAMIWLWKRLEKESLDKVSLQRGIT
jgi:exosortase/archaeosortase family protein